MDSRICELIFTSKRYPSKLDCFGGCFVSGLVFVLKTETDPVYSPLIYKQFRKMNDSRVVKIYQDFEIDKHSVLL